MKKSLLFFLSILLLLPVLVISCSKDENNDEPVQKRRTMLIFMSGENNLSELNYLSNDLKEIRIGASTLPDDVNLIVYVDPKSKTERPYISQFNSKGETRLRTYSEDFYSCDPENMKEIMQWVFSNYPAKSYALSLWGHADGWVMKSSYDSYAKSLSYGADLGVDHNGSGMKWINITTLNDVLATLPHLDYIFFDCCFMQCVEVAYELRNRCDYIIASPVEIPGDGAPYKTVVPQMFAEKDKVGKAIVDAYIAGSDFGNAAGLPLSVVNTGSLEAFAHATKTALTTIMNNYGDSDELNLNGLLYYYRSYLSNENPMMFDMRNFMRKYLSPSDFATWDNVLSQTVIYSVHPEDIRDTNCYDWQTSQDINFYDFVMNDDNYGGISMFIPQKKYNKVEFPVINPNNSIFETQWGNAVLK